MSLFAALLRLRITLGVLVLLTIILYKGSCSSDIAPTECSRWCGVHNVSHPFRLRDSPAKCGDKRYTLSCEEDNNQQQQLVLHLGYGKYYVQSINYNNFTIRLVDANLSLLQYSSNYSLPPYSLGLYDLNISNIRGPYHEYPYYRFSDIIILVKYMVLVRCPNRVDSSGSQHFDIDGATCMNTSSYAHGSSLFVVYGNESLGDLGLGDTCRIEFMYLTSWPVEIFQGRGNNMSCTDIRRMLFYGFELSWINGLCEDGRYVRQIDSNHQPRCFPRGGLWNLSDILFLVSNILESILALVVLLCGVKFVLGAPCVIVLLIYKWRRRHLSMYEGIEDFLRSDNNIMPIRYSYRDIKKITEQFKTKLGNGGYGSVFKGKLRSGRLVAVKVLLDKAKSNGQDFINEVTTIGRIHHVNVVQLIGFCVEGSKRALIYEFMPNGSLEKHIFSSHHEDGHTRPNSLSCEKLYAISLGVARGIEYLHNGCNMKILHFDIKPHNILLDENFNPKVSDFGLARLCPTDNSIVSLTAARGTIGYMAPELFYRNVGTVSYKADVYSFGMLLMEMASKRKNLNALAEQSSQIYFPFWVYDRLRDGREVITTTTTIENDGIDDDDDDDEEMNKLEIKMMVVALWCIQTRPGDRPPMHRVLEMLEEEDEELQLPNKPYLFPEDLPAEDVRDDDSTISSSWSSSATSIRDSKEST